MPNFTICFSFPRLITNKASSTTQKRDDAKNRHAMQAAFPSCIPGLFKSPAEDMPAFLLSWQKEIPAVTGGAALQVGTGHATNMSGSSLMMHRWHAWLALLLNVRLSMMPHLLHRLDTLSSLTTRS